MPEQIGVEVVAIGVAAFSRALRTAQDDLDRFSSKIDSSANIATNMGKKLQSIGDGMQQLGRSMTIGITAPLGILTGSLITAGIKFEETFAGIGKTVDGISVGFDEIKDAAQDRLGITITTMDEAKEAAARMGMAFGDLTPLGKDVENQFRQMALEIPIASTELNKFGEIAGQFGVAAEDIAGVTRSMAYLDVATDLAGDQAGSMLIQMRNITKSTVPMAEFVNRAGSALVDLGNNSVSTEGQILDMTMRLAGAGEMAKFTEQQMLAWATTIADLGVRPEKGGTAVSRMINEMMVSLQTGSDEAQVFADVMGVTVEELQKMFEEDASNAILVFTQRLTEGLSGTNSSIKITKKMLTAMGLGGVRAIDVVQRLSDAQSMFTTNLDRANKAWGEGIALQEEAEKKSNTVAAQIQLTRSAFGDLGITLFELVENDIKKFLAKVRDVISWFKNLDKGILKTILKIASIAAAIGPALVVFGALASAVGTALTALGGLPGMILRLAPAILGALGPIGLLVAGFAALVLFLAKNLKVDIDFSPIIFKAKETIGVITKEIGKIVEAFANIKIGDVGLLESLQQLLDTVIQGIMNKSTLVMEFIQNLAKVFSRAFIPFITDKGPQIERILGNFKQIVDNVREAFGKIGTSIATAFGVDMTGTAVGEFLGTLAGMAFEGLLNGLEKASGFVADLSGSLDSIGQNATVQAIIKGVADAVSQLADSLTTISGLLAEGDILGAFGALTGGNEDIAQFFSGFATAVIVAQAAIGAFVSALVSTLGPTVTGIFNQITGLLNDLGLNWNDVWEALKTSIGIVAQIIGAILIGLLGIIVGILSGIASAIEQVIIAFRNILPHIMGVVEGIIRVFTGLWLFFDKLFHGDFPAAFLALQTVFSGIAQVVTNIWGIMGESIKGGFNIILGFIKGFVTGVYNFFTTLYNNLVGHSIIPDMINSIVSWFYYFRDVVVGIVQWVRDVISGVFNSIMYSFDLLGWKIGVIVGDARWYLDQLGSKVQEVLSMITGSPELIIQHPFEKFESYLKSVDFGRLIDTSLSVSNITQPAVVAPASGGDTTTNVDRRVTANISGVQATTAEGIAEILVRQVRIAEAFQS